MRAFADHYSEGAANYRRSRPSYPVALIDWLAAFAGRRTLAWDAGCGSGQLSLPLAAAFEHVVASDVSYGQVAAAPAHRRVCYRVARSEASALPDAVTDLCVAAQAAHWFDLEAYFSEVGRVARPGSAVALVTYARPRLASELDDLLEHLHTVALAPFWPEERRHVEDRYRSLSFPFDEAPAAVFEMVHRWDLTRFRGYVESWSAVRACREGAGSEHLDSFLGEMGRRWGEPHLQRDVRWPVTLRTGRV